MRTEIASVTWRAAGIAAVSCLAACSGKAGDSRGSGGASAAEVNERGGGSATAGSATGAGGGALPECDTAENNLSVWGFDETPFTMSGKAPVLSLSGPLPGADYNALLFQTSVEMAASGAGIVSVNLVSPAGNIASGKDVKLGNGAKLQVFGQITTAEGTSYFSCTGNSGEARINSLSARRGSDTGPGDVPAQENVSFVVNCTGQDTKPASVEQVRGCYNLANATD